MGGTLFEVVHAMEIELAFALVVGLLYLVGRPTHAPVEKGKVGASPPRAASSPSRRPRQAAGAPA
eukprot:CAMPEP_0175297820 /NCGR_PEP_ID=MMETSP0093-20121207/59763_1 /TAXON_ID=311494 /ORGANISM="Alexandrium monilatum, Strain CCMP3105" /LENGTH=64 /DNA_ID=CAMNT_0016593903 /DNA_START=88 /DNA_END=279 /DNA_ORIENTATION=-